MGNSAGKETRSESPLYESPPVVGAASSSRRPRARSSGGERHSSLAATRSAVRHALNMEETVDGGYLVPQGVYSGPQDFKARVVRQLMVSRCRRTSRASSVLLAALSVRVYCTILSVVRILIDFFSFFSTDRPTTSPVLQRARRL